MKWYPQMTPQISHFAGPISFKFLAGHPGHDMYKMTVGLNWPTLALGAYTK